MENKKVDPKTFPKYTPNPIFKGLPAMLKDPANYETVQRRLLETLASTHSHSDVEEWAKCVDCMVRVEAHKLEMRRLGFKSPEQYMAWKKVMHVLINNERDPLNGFYDKEK